MVAHQAPERGVHVREFLRITQNLAVNLVEDTHVGTRQLLPTLPDWARLGVPTGNAILFVSYSPLHSLSLERTLFAAHTASLPLLVLWFSRVEVGSDRS